MEHQETFIKLVASTMTPVNMVQRAKILLLKVEGCSIDSIGINRRTVLLLSQKYRNRSADDTLEKVLGVARGRGTKEEISSEGKTWIIGIARQKPKVPGCVAQICIMAQLYRGLLQ